MGSAMTLPSSSSFVNTNPAIEALRSSCTAALSERIAPTRATIFEHAFVTYLLAMGRGVLTPEGTFWLDTDGRAWAPDSTEFLVRIACLAHLPVSSREVEAALKGAVKHACFGASRTEATTLRLAAQGTDGVLYVRASDCSLLRVDATGVTLAPNGTAGLLVIGGDDFQPLGELPPPSEKPLEPLYNLINRYFRFRDVDEWAGPVLFALLVVYFLLPRGMAGSRPVLLFLGEGGVGKTTLLRIFLWILWGPEVRVEAPPDRGGQHDFETLLGTSAVLAIDDPDRGEKAPWLSALVRAATTGATRRRRKLYTDTQVIELRPDLRLLVSANENPFPRSHADTSRLLPIWLEPRVGEAVPEGELEAAALALRPQVWADALELLRRSFVTGQIATTAVRRLSGFEIWMATLAHHIAYQPEIERALDALDIARHKLVLEEHILAEAAEAYAVPGRAWEGSASKLLEKLRGKTASKRDIRWDGWTAAKIGRVLSEIAPAMLAARGIRITQLPRRGSGRLWRIEQVE